MHEHDDKGRSKLFSAPLLFCHELMRSSRVCNCVSKMHRDLDLMKCSTLLEFYPVTDSRNPDKPTNKILTPIGLLSLQETLIVLVIKIGHHYYSSHKE